jgi:hypothetical protein
MENLDVQSRVRLTNSHHQRVTFQDRQPCYHVLPFFFSRLDIAGAQNGIVFSDVIFI